MIWVILGIVLGTLLYHIVVNARAGKFQVRWYQWILGVVAVVLFLVTVQNYLALQDELEPSAAGLIWLVSGLPAAVLLALIWIIPAAGSLVGKKRAVARPSAVNAP